MRQGNRRSRSHSTRACPACRGYRSRQRHSFRRLCQEKGWGRVPVGCRLLLSLRPPPRAFRHPRPVPLLLCSQRLPLNQDSHTRRRPLSHHKLQGRPRRGRASRRNHPAGPPLGRRELLLNRDNRPRCLPLPRRGLQERPRPRRASRQRSPLHQPRFQGR